MSQFCKRTALLLIVVTLMIAEATVADSVGSAKACGVDNYKSKIADVKKNSANLKEDAASMESVNPNQVAIVQGGGVVHAGTLAAIVAIGDNAKVLGNDRQLVHYQEVIDTISEAQKAADLSRLTDQNKDLFHTTRLINSYYKNAKTGRAYSMNEVAFSIQRLVRSGTFCHPDGNLAVTGEFRDLIAKDLGAKPRIVAPAQSGSNMNSNAVDHVKPDEQPPAESEKTKVSGNSGTGE